LLLPRQKKSQNQSNKTEEATAMKSATILVHTSNLILLTFHQVIKEGSPEDKNNLKKRIRTFQLLKPFAGKIN